MNFQDISVVPEDAILDVAPSTFTSESDRYLISPCIEQYKQTAGNEKEGDCKLSPSFFRAGARTNRPMIASSDISAQRLLRRT